MSGTFWKGKRVLVTGHTGFKGSWLSVWLHDLGAEVTGFSLPAPTEPSLFEDAAVADGLNSVIGDIRDPDAVSKVVGDCDPEIVIHLAALALVHEGYRKPLEAYTTNVIGTANVLQHLRDRSALRAVVSVTSDKCYRDAGAGRVCREGDPLGGDDPYSSSKAAAELVTAAYRRAFFSASASARAVLTTARAGNVIGGGDWAADRLIPDLIRGFLAGEAVAIRSPEAVRPWQHVLEPLCGYLDLAEASWHDGDSRAGAWNFGPDEIHDRTVRQVADRMANLWGEGAIWCLDARVHPPETGVLRLDSAKARRELGWQPVLSIDDALQWTVEWYRARERKDDLRETTLAQIRRYEQKRHAR
jgi:CDP-glucose 4,6-dehydratase